MRCSRLRCFPPTACVRGVGSGLCPWAAPPCQLQTRLLLRRPAPGGPGTARFSTGCCLRQPHLLTSPPGCVRPAQHRDSAPDEGRRVNEEGTAGPGRAGFLAADHRLRDIPRLWLLPCVACTAAVAVRGFVVRVVARRAGCKRLHVTRAPVCRWSHTCTSCMRCSPHPQNACEGLTLPL